MDDSEGRDPGLHALEADDLVVDYEEVGLVVVLEPHGEGHGFFGEEGVEVGLEEREVLGEGGADLPHRGLVGLNQVAEFRDSC